MDENIFARIEKLFDIGLMADAEVLIAGCGSGGASVALQLAMSGLQNFTLVDNDILEPENVIRHVCGLRYVGKKKVDAVADVLRDRNPKVKLRLLHEDLLGFADLDAEIRRASVVVLATDNDPTRYAINGICVNTGTPFVVGKVFTRGIGGEAFAYRPRQGGGCLACLEGMLERTTFREGIREIDLVSDEERDAIYGTEVAEIKDSPGLNVDISFITAFHTRFVLDAIASGLPERPKYLSPIPENYVIWGNRPVHPFKKNFELQRITLKKQDGCLVCGGLHDA
jgi:molybdopterin/thiamine biosynthesis adenylyltransferase